VRLPKAIVRRKEPIGKEEIRQILLKCSDIKLKTYVMLLAATGMRATEALALRYKDFDFGDAANDNRNNNHQQALCKDTRRIHKDAYGPICLFDKRIGRTVQSLD